MVSHFSVTYHPETTLLSSTETNKQFRVMYSLYVKKKKKGRKKEKGEKEKKKGSSNLQKLFQLLSLSNFHQEFAYKKVKMS